MRETNVQLRYQRKGRTPVVHAQLNSSTAVCGKRTDEEKRWVLTSSEVNCGHCLRVIAFNTRSERTCTVCGETKDLDDFYYNGALDTTTANCKACQSKLNALRKKLKAEGKKISVKEFREQKLYARMELVDAKHTKGGWGRYEIVEEVAQ